MRNFEILTLKDNQMKYARLNDAVSIITAGASILSQIFPNIFGGSRKRLTAEDWNQLIPGNGFWTVQLRNYLATRIHYDVDFQTNVQPFTIQFVADHKAGICPTFNTDNHNWTACYQKFLQMLKQETQTSGNLPVGQTPGISSGFDWNTIIPIALIGLVAVAVLKKNKRGRK